MGNTNRPTKQGAPTNQPSQNGVVFAQNHVHIGSLPAPETLAQYDAVLPGAAERILKMAEDEANHRRDMDRFTGKASVRAANWGIICAFMSVVLVCGLVAFAIYKDFSTAASTIAVGAIATVASVFIFFKRKGK